MLRPATRGEEEKQQKTSEQKLHLQGEKSCDGWTCDIVYILQNTHTDTLSVDDGEKYTKQCLFLYYTSECDSFVVVVDQLFHHTRNNKE